MINQPLMPMCVRSWCDRTAYCWIMDGDDWRGWIRYCLTVIWPGVAVFALCAWGSSRTRGGAHVALEVAVAIVWIAIVILGINGYRKYLRRRFPVFHR